MRSWASSTAAVAVAVVGTLCAAPGRALHAGRLNVRVLQVIQSTNSYDHDNFDDPDWCVRQGAPAHSW